MSQIRRSKRLATELTNVVSPEKKIKREVGIKSEYFDICLPADESVKVKPETEVLTIPLENKPEINVIKKEPKSVKIKNELITPIPENFVKIYSSVKTMRSKIIAPVDTMGCERLPERVAGKTTPQNFRYQLLVSLMLSSQTKDEVNYQAMVKLHNGLLEKGFKDGLCLEAILDTDERQIDQWIYSVGFHNRKAGYLKRTAEILRDKFEGDVPKTIEEITSLPGVGPKMGYLLLHRAWNVNDGIGVDVHVFRLANMWKWVPKIAKPNPEHTRIELQKWLPKEYWDEINPLLVGFGQTVCLPRGRRCDLCSLATTGICNNVDRQLLRQRQNGVPTNAKNRGDVSALLGDIEDIC